VAYALVRAASTLVSTPEPSSGTVQKIACRPSRRGRPRNRNYIFAVVDFILSILLVDVVFAFFVFVVDELILSWAKAVAVISVAAANNTTRVFFMV
jgi:hypothetical protein